MLPRYWHHLGITQKFSLIFLSILFLIILLTIFSYLMLSTTYRQTVVRIEKSTNIQKLVLEMDDGLEKARRFKKGIFFKAKISKSFNPDNNALEKVYEQLTHVSKQSERLKQLISHSSVSEELQKSHINLNLYYSMANRCRLAVREMVELLEKLSARDSGFHHLLNRQSQILQKEIEGLSDDEISMQFYHMQLYIKDYLLTEKRPFMQSAINSAFFLHQGILSSGHFGADKKEHLISLVENYMETAEKIPPLIVMIQSKSNEFDLNTETLEPVSANLLDLAQQEVERAQEVNEKAVKKIGVLMICAALFSLCLICALAFIIHRTITRNIVHLTHVAAQLQSSNFEVRARLKNRDELGILADTFNQMSSRLKEMIHGLEDQVDKRTRELIAANRSLQKEIAERKQAEVAREKLEAELRQSQKMEAIGTIAGGIAHDFNNILGIILGNAELALDDAPDWHPLKSNLLEIRTACLRAKEVVLQLLRFSRKTKLEQQPIKLVSVVAESMKLLRSSLPTSIEIRADLPDDCHTILGDPTQIHQVILNLSNNAAHAMEENGGILSICLEDIFIDKPVEKLKNLSSLKPGRYVQIRISDTGHGISPDVIEKIFDPYFTTKEIGKGTGMGLSIVHGIVRSHKGDISVTSHPGKGTTVTLIFPESKAQLSEEKSSDNTLPRGRETILFVDDEAALVNMTEQKLQRLGYNVQAFTSPTEALDAVKRHPDLFDLVLTDMTMPEMTGDDLARQILAIRPDMPMVLCTGFNAKISEEQARRIGFRGYIEKPLAQTDLAVAVRKALDNG